MAQTIPVLRFRDFVSGDAVRRQQFIQTLGRALEQIGFFALTEHGIDRELIRSAYEVAEAVFALPNETKACYEDLTLKGQRGFTAFAREHAKTSSYADLKEFWHIGRENAVPKNLWPAEVPEFRQTMLALFDQLEQCANVLLEACALYLDLPVDTLSTLTENGPTLLRVLHYPPIPSMQTPAGLRAAAHEDINLITLLCEATTPGLELQQADGRWLPITAIPGQIIVDTGDMLQNLTNGLFKSTTHRVVNPDSDRDRRFSLPFFVHPRPEIDLSPLPNCIHRTSGHSQFPNLTARQYLAQRLQEIGLG